MQNHRISLPPAAPSPQPQNASHTTTSYSAAAATTSASPAASVASPAAHATGPPSTSYTPPPQPTDSHHRQSLPGANSVTLPSMRTIDAISHQQQQQQQQQPAPHHHGANTPLPPPVSSSSAASYYSHSSYGPPSDLARYPIPHDPRIHGGRGPKKVFTAQYFFFELGEL
jgi:hypothetical protein